VPDVVVYMLLRWCVLRWCVLRRHHSASLQLRQLSSQLSTHYDATAAASLRKPEFCLQPTVGQLRDGQSAR
jgi:hypothetical protein